MSASREKKKRQTVTDADMTQAHAGQKGMSKTTKTALSIVAAILVVAIIVFFALVSTGFFVTNQNRALLFNEDGSPTARTGKILAATPMKKFGETKDLLGALLWLSDDEASGFVTGTVIPVDGGFSAYSGV